MGTEPYQILYLNIYTLFYVSYIAIKLFYKVNVKQPRCPSTDEWIKKMWYIYTMEYCLRACKLNHSVVSDSLRPHGLANQALLSVEFSSQIDWSG